MEAVPRAIAAALALAALLAGCAEPPPEAAPGEPVAAATGPAAAPEGFAAGVPEGRVAVDTPGEAAGTAWVRAYWGERREVVLVDADVELSALVSGPQGCYLQCRGAFERPGPGLLAAPGTEAVEVTLAIEPPPTAPGLGAELFWTTAASSEVQRSELVPGDPLRIPVAAADADAPFQAASLWWFFVRVHATPTGAVPPTTGHLTVVALRGASLPEVADPPDPWRGGDTIELVAAAERASRAVLVGPSGALCLPCGMSWPPDDGALVPPGAAEVRATLAWTWTGPKPVLRYFNAAQYHGEEPDPEMPMVEDGDAQRTYLLPVPEGQWDSPWQRRSHWDFWAFYEEGGAPAGAAEGTATLHVVVARAAAPADAAAP